METSVAPATIVIAEDESPVAQTVSSCLGDIGHVVKWVRTVREARDILREEPPDILLLDVALDTDGLELFQAIRFSNEHPRGGVIVLVDRTDVHNQERAYQLGAAAVLKKPLDNDELVITISEILALVR